MSGVPAAVPDSGDLGGVAVQHRQSSTLS